MKLLKYTVEVECSELTADRIDRLPVVRVLYESAFDEAERIPWEWLERGVNSTSPNAMRIVVAERQTELLGFAIAVYLPGYGGYLSYIAVDTAVRRGGVGRKLFEKAFALLERDASMCREKLPFVIWESRKPNDREGKSARDLWTARCKLFGKVGGSWIEGITLQSPNWLIPTEPHVPMQLFLAPRGEPISAFDAERTHAAVDGLLRRVYRCEPGDGEYERSLTPGCQPRLRAATEADRGSGFARIPPSSTIARVEFTTPEGCR